MEHLIRDSRHLAVVLKTARKAKCLTQAKTGEKTGLLQKTVSRLESDQADRCSIESFMKLLAALNIEMVLREAPTEGTDDTKVEW